MTTTSLDAYHEIVANGLLARRQLIVYDYIRSHGPVSINTMLTNLAKPGDNTGAWTGRVCELRDMGVIQWAGEEPGPKGQPVTLWKVVPGAFPKKLAKHETAAARVKHFELMEKAARALTDSVLRGGPGNRDTLIDELDAALQWKAVTDGSGLSFWEAVRRERKNNA